MMRMFGPGEIEVHRDHYLDAWARRGDNAFWLVPSLGLSIKDGLVGLRRGLVGIRAEV